MNKKIVIGIVLSFLIIISFSLILFVTSIYINKKRGV